MRLIAAAAGIVAAVCSAFADDKPCYGMPTLGVDTAVAPYLAIVKPGDRARFVNGGDRAGCANASAACATRGFVVGGDAVVVSATAGDYACATFRSRAEGGFYLRFPAARTTRRAAAGGAGQCIDSVGRHLVVRR